MSYEAGVAPAVVEVAVCRVCPRAYPPSGVDVPIVWPPPPLIYLSRMRVRAQHAPICAHAYVGFLFLFCGVRAAVYGSMPRRGLKKVRATLTCSVLSAPKRRGGRLNASGRLVARSLKR